MDSKKDTKIPVMYVLRKSFLSFATSQAEFLKLLITIIILFGGVG